MTTNDAAPAPDADGLITLLRWLDRKGGLGYEAHEAIARAADLIAAQAAQIASLTAELAERTRERDELAGLQSRAEGRIKAIVDDELLRRAEKAEAECERLREDAKWRWGRRS